MKLCRKLKEHPGAQIDLLIRRADRIINLCEMKFSVSDFMIDQDEDARMRNRKSVYQYVTHCKEPILPVLVTTFGLVRNKYSSSIQRVITMDDLFEEC